MINRSRPLKRLFPAFGLALTASLAIAALAAGSASALSLVNEKGEAPFRTITIQAGATTVSASTGAWSCSSVAAAGALLDATSGELQGLAFKGCSSGGIPCTTAGQATGTILTPSLSMKLVYLDALKTQFGMLFTPPAGTPFAQCSAFGMPNTWTGSLIGQIVKPAFGVSSNSATLLFEGAKGQQAKQQIEETGTKYFLTQELGKMTPTSLAVQASTTMTYSNGEFRKFIP
jgi:hypothetical protein